MYNHNHDIVGSSSWSSVNTGGVTNISPSICTAAITSEKIINTLNIKINKLKENETMETLYQVVMVTKEKGIVVDEKVVAVDQEDAKFKAKVYEALKEIKLTPADVTIVVTVLGQVKVNK